MSILSHARRGAATATAVLALVYSLSCADAEPRTMTKAERDAIADTLRGLIVNAYDLSAPRSFVSKRVIDGRRYEVHVFQRALFPLTSGRYEIPAARLNYSLPLSASFFSREESHQLRSETVPRSSRTAVTRHGSSNTASRPG